jgi:hypothetical protein
VPTSALLIYNSKRSFLLKYFLISSSPAIAVYPCVVMLIEYSWYWVACLWLLRIRTRGVYHPSANCQCSCCSLVTFPSLFFSFLFCRQWLTCNALRCCGVSQCEQWIFPVMLTVFTKLYSKRMLFIYGSRQKQWWKWRANKLNTHGLRNYLHRMWQ